MRRELGIDANIQVAVLMSSYNGSKYIEEQIRSIIMQDFPGEITIILRDDGSSDNTLQIVNRMVFSKNRKLIAFKESNVGPQKSFMKLLHFPLEADYYFFSDQDDVWISDKIKRAVSMMKGRGNRCLYCSDYMLTDSKLNVLQRSCVKIESRTFNPLYTIFYNEFPGCTMGFDNDFIKLLREIKLEHIIMHDSMSLALAAVTGTICYDAEPTIYHRIHENNVVGSGHKKVKPTKWLKDKALLLKNKEDYDLSKMAEQFLIVGNSLIDSKYINDLFLLKDFKKSYINTLKLLCHPDTKNKLCDRTTLSIICKILFHIF